jgi:hypothetical protein
MRLIPPPARPPFTRPPSPPHPQFEQAAKQEALRIQTLRQDGSERDVPDVQVMLFKSVPPGAAGHGLTMRDIKVCVCVCVCVGGWVWAWVSRSARFKSKSKRADQSMMGYSPGQPIRPCHLLSACNVECRGNIESLCGAHSQPAPTHGNVPTPIKRA